MAVARQVGLPGRRRAQAAPGEDPGRRPAASPFGLRAVIALLLAAATLAIASVLVIALLTPAGPLGDWTRQAAIHDARASALLAKKIVNARDLAAAERETRLALGVAPMDDGAWLRLAYLDALRHGRLTPQGVLALKRSFDVAPLGPEVSEWRVRFCAAHWADLSPELRQAAARDLRGLYLIAPGAATSLVSRLPNNEAKGSFAPALTG